MRDNQLLFFTENNYSTVLFHNYLTGCQEEVIYLETKLVFPCQGHPLNLKEKVLSIIQIWFYFYLSRKQDVKNYIEVFRMPSS